MHCQVGTCQLEIFVWIESRIESAATIRIRIEYRIESGYTRLRVIIIITGEQWCADSPGSSNNIARSLASAICLHKHKNHKHKMNLNYNGETVEVFFVEQWARFVVRLRVRLIRKFRIGSSLSNRIESESSDLNSNRISKLCRSLLSISTTERLSTLQRKIRISKPTTVTHHIPAQLAGH